ncbi:glutamine--fructose-6-phosphate aminotransferase, partial [Candidatus Geothermarchaeota archaeon]
EETVVVAISQSGETADTLDAIKAAKGKGARTLGIVNVMGSTLTRIVDRYIGQNSGPEIGVAATKTYTGQLSVISRISVYCGVKTGKIKINEGKDLLEKLHEIPNLVKENLDYFSVKTKEIAPYLASNKSICFLGRGVNVATALESRLKMLEISYIPAISYPSGESKHGFIAVVEEGYPIILFAPVDETYDDNLSTIMEMKARGAKIIAITEEKAEEIKRVADIVIFIPETIDLLTPITMVIPGQLMAYHTAVYLNRDPDKPRSLAKSVTVK